jgi:hypothetical protein
MRQVWHCAPRGLVLAMTVAFLLLPDAGRAVPLPRVAPLLRAPLPRKDKEKIPAVRWDEQRPGCTFSRSDDGHYHYGLWYEDVGITMTVDSQELEKVHRRSEPFFSVNLDVRYRGPGSVDLAIENISLQFMKHFKVIQSSLDPDSFVDKVQSDADERDHEAAREVGKHPEKKEEKDAYVKALLKDSAELQEFVGKNSLRPTLLGPGNPEKSGWVLFSTQSKWISGWKKQEEFILRVPLGGKVFEFPFKLPPKPGEIMLRKRE